MGAAVAEWLILIVWTLTLVLRLISATPSRRAWGCSVAGGARFTSFRVLQRASSLHYQ